MGYNKPITARIQHSTNKGMKVQEPLLDIGSATKKKELNYGADTSLTSGVENSKFVDIAKPLAEGADGPKAAAKQTAGQTAMFGPEGSKPNPGLYAGIVAEAKKKGGAQAVAKNYNNFKSYKVGKGGKR